MLTILSCREMLAMGHRNHCPCPYLPTVPNSSPLERISQSVGTNVTIDCPLLSIVVHCCPSVSFLVLPCPSLCFLVHHCPSSPILVHGHSAMSIVGYGSPQSLPVPISINTAKLQSWSGTSYTRVLDAPIARRSCSS
jgi:hypothetical protein